MEEGEVRLSPSQRLMSCRQIHHLPWLRVRGDDRLEVLALQMGALFLWWAWVRTPHRELARTRSCAFSHFMVPQ